MAIVSMRKLFGLKNMIMFSAVLLTIGSVSAQQAFAGVPVLINCISNSDGNWNNSSNWSSCDGGTPNTTTNATIQFDHDIIITGDEETQRLRVQEQSTLFIDCDASLNLFSAGSVDGQSIITNHGILTSVDFLTIFGDGSILFNSGDHSGVVTASEGAIMEISTKCTQPIGGTVGSMGTVSLIVAGAQGSMGWWSLALVGVAVAVGSGIVYKVKSNKTKEE